MTTELTIADQAAALIPRQAESDEQLIALWLHGRSEHTQRAYRSDVERFLTFVQLPLRQVTLGDVQAFADELEEQRLQPSSRRRILSAVKSLFAFAHRLGYLPFDVARPLKLRGVREGLADRILDEGQVLRMVALETNPRNHALLSLLYVAGLRVSEVCSLSWRDLQPRNDGGQVTVMGKRDKTRTILLPSSIWSLLFSLRGNESDTAPIFKSRKRGHLSTSQVWRIVRKAARRAGINKNVCCHMLRHSHASHSLDRGAPIHLVQATLGHASVATTGRYLHARPNDSSSRYLPL